MSRSLDKKLTFAGFEVLDLWGLLLVVSILNLVFGSTGLQLYFVWLPALVMALLLRYGKRGKPDKFLIHLIKFYLRPPIVSAYPTLKQDLNVRRKELN